MCCNVFKVDVGTMLVENETCSNLVLLSELFNF